MTTLITLLLWLTLLGLAAWRPVRYRPYGSWMAPCGVLAALALSEVLARRRGDGVEWWWTVPGWPVRKRRS